MITRLFAIALVAATAGCTTPAPQDPPRKPGFLERAWTSGKKSTRAAWESTVSTAGSGWRSTTEFVASPFSKSKNKPAGSHGRIRELVTEIQIKPEPVRLATTRALEVAVVITNKAEQSVQLDFPTSQHLELVVKTESGGIIQRWSDDQRVEREASFVAINPSERLEYSTSLSTRSMAAGKTYIIEATVPGYPAIFARKVVVPQ
jgi:hypothetical protein